MNSSSVTVSAEAAKVVAFLKEYRVLECSCCTNIFGFQHRTTGALYCVGGCHERPSVASPLGALGPQVMMQVPKLIGIEKPVPEPTAAPAISAPIPKPEIRPAAVTAANKPKTEDVTDNRKQAPVPAPTAAAPKPTPAAAKTEAPKPVVASKSETPKPVAPATPKNLWSSMKYSQHLTNSDSQVRVQFAWTPINYTVIADADEGALGDMQEAVKAYALKAKRLQQAPAENEIVIGEYDGEYYRARVVKIQGDMCDVAFIDYGDKKTCKFTELVPVDAAIMKHPVYGMNVHVKLPVDVGGFKFDASLEDAVYGESYILDMTKKAVPAVPGQAEYFDVRLWDLVKESTLNEKITAAVTNAARNNWTSLTPDEQSELAYFLSKSSHFRETKKIVENIMREEAQRRNQLDLFVFKLDNADYPYSIQDLPLIKPSCLGGVVKVQVVSYKSLNSVIVRLLGKAYDSIINEISFEIKSWIASRDSKALKNLQTDFVPGMDELCIVKWPEWGELAEIMVRLRGKKWLSDYAEDLEGQEFSINKDDYQQHCNKWFRAACASETKGFKPRFTTDPERSPEDEKEIVYQMFLVDLGKKTFIPSKYVYRIPHRFMIQFQTCLYLNVALDHIAQYDDSVDEKWKYLLLPGLKLEIKCLWMFDEINIVKLVSPSEKEFEDHFCQPSVQEAIQNRKATLRKLQLHQKAKKLSIKGTYAKTLEKLEAEEAELEKIKQFNDKYSGIGRIHPDRILDLRLPD